MKTYAIYALCYLADVCERIQGWADRMIDKLRRG
jgi:hypothetical protein